MNKLKTWNNISLDQLKSLSEDLRRLLRIPSIVILSGDVGAGKTTFVKYFAGECDISSPTYSLISDYEDLVHADLYRLENPSELIHLELELYSEGKSYFFFEWGKEYYSQLRMLLGDDYHYYELLIESQGPKRLFTLSRFPD